MIKGIDVSTFQGNIDWKTVKNAGVDFAIIRGGFGNNASQKDDKVIQNLEGALSVGIPVGVYWFSYAVSAADARREAEVCDSIIRPYKDRITLPVFYDFEYDSDRYAREHGVIPDKKLITDMTIAFMDRMKELGYKSGFYTNLDYGRNKYDMSRMAGYKLWMAYYQDEKYEGAYVQQYTSKGSVPGISGNVDLDYCFDEIEAIAPPGALPKFNVGSDYTLQDHMRVRTGAGVDKQQKSRSELTANGKKNAMPYDSAVLKAGTVVTCLETKVVNGNEVWLRIPSGWVCGYFKGEVFIK